jgi:hypothetical protein
LTPSGVRKWVCRFSTSSSAMSQPFRRARIERVAQAVADEVHRRTVTDRNAAGKSTMNGFTCHSARPSAMMLPQDGMVGELVPI